jgi:hypothetical protein
MTYMLEFQVWPETMELRKDNEIKYVQKGEVCSICEVIGHTIHECPTIPTFKEVLI